MEGNDQIIQSQDEQHNFSPKKTIYIVTVVVLIAIISLIIFYTPHKSSYEISDPIVIDGDFIYLTDCYKRTYRESSCPSNGKAQLIISDIRGKDVRVLKSFDYDPGRFSPQGSYYEKFVHTYSETYEVIIVDAHGNEVFTLPDYVHKSSTPQYIGSEEDGGIAWSNDERFIAQIIQPCKEGTTCSNLHLWETSEYAHFVIYDLVKKQKIFYKELDNLLYPEIGEPYSTDPRIIWSDVDNTLYTYNEKGIYAVSNLENNPVVSFLDTPVPCLGLAVKASEYFCHSKMGTIYPHGVNNPQESAQHTYIFKYIRNEEKLSGPIQVTLKGALVDGEYNAKLSFLNYKYLMFVPVLGYQTIVDIETGKIAKTWGSNNRRYDLPIFFGSKTENSGTMSFPVRYIPLKTAQPEQH
ncbi:MAG: hypothetical protein AAB420_03510 [Patescibacteria group bacterium]